MHGILLKLRIVNWDSHSVQNEIHLYSTDPGHVPIWRIWSFYRMFVSFAFLRIQIVAICYLLSWNLIWKYLFISYFLRVPDLNVACTDRCEIDLVKCISNCPADDVECWSQCSRVNTECIKGNWKFIQFYNFYCWSTFYINFVKLHLIQAVLVKRIVLMVAWTATIQYVIVR